MAQMAAFLPYVMAAGTAVSTITQYQAMKYQAEVANKKKGIECIGMIIICFFALLHG